MSDLATDLDALLVVEDRQPLHKTCSVAIALESMTPEQREKLDVLLQDGCPVPATKVAATLTKWGFRVNYHSVQRHRRRHRGGCLCP